MQFESTAQEHPAYPFDESTGEPRSFDVRPPRRNLPSPLYCLLFLIACVAAGEIFEGFILHRLTPYLNYDLLLLVDIFSMLVIILPAFYFFIYRPMRSYAAKKAAAEQQVKSLSRQLVLQGDRERLAVAKSLHEQLAPSLLTFQQSLAALQLEEEECEPARQEQFNKLIRQLAQLRQRLRSVATRLAPAQLQEYGLVASIEAAVKDFQERGAGFNVDFLCRGLEKPLPDDLALTCFQVFWDSMNNILCHAEATRVQVVLEGDSKEIVLSIRDNGIGFEPDAEAGEMTHYGVGLLRMRERVRALGGEFHLRSQLGKGTCVEIRVALPEANGSWQRNL